MAKTPIFRIQMYYPNFLLVDRDDYKEELITCLISVWAAAKQSIKGVQGKAEEI